MITINELFAFNVVWARLFNPWFLVREELKKEVVPQVLVPAAW